MRRSPAVALSGAFGSTLALAAAMVVHGCTEPLPLEQAGGSFSVTIERVSGPDTLVIGDEQSYEYAVVDAQARTVLNPDLGWSVSPQGVLVVESPAQGESRLVTAADLGRGALTVSLNSGPFTSTARQDSVSVLLGGVAIQGGVQDTATVTALHDTLIVRARGLDVDSGAVANTGMSWSLTGSGVLTLQALGGGDSARVIAQAAGVETVTVTHAQCSGACADTVRVDVAPVVTAAAVTPAQDTLLAGDTTALVASGRDRRGNVVVGASFQWSSLDTAVASVSATGVVTAADSGVARIVAIAPSGVADTAQVTVPATGALQVQIADAPTEYYSSAWLYTSGLYTLDSVVTRGRRYLSTAPQAFDLLTLQNGATATAGTVNVPTGTVGAVYLRLDSVAVDLAAGYRFADMTTRRSLPLPAGSDSLRVDLAAGASVARNDTLRVVVEFDVNRNFPLADEPGTDSIVGQVTFRPRPRGLDRAIAAAITGSVTAPDSVNLRELTLRADGAADTLTARADTSGAYTFYHVTPGTYTVGVLSLPQCHVLSPLTRMVAPAAGQTVTANFGLNAVSLGRIELSPLLDTLHAIGDTLRLTAVARDPMDAEVQGVEIQYASSAEAVASAGSGGLVIAQGNGTATITASSCGVDSTMTVVVKQISASVQLVDPQNGLVELSTAGTHQVLVTVADSNGVAIAGAPVVWSSSDPTVATVSSSGLVTAVAPGNATITASADSAGSVVNETLTVLVTLEGLVNRSLTAGTNYTCDLDQSGGAWCWGENDQGQLGDGTREDRQAPTPVSGSLTFSTLTAGHDHTCGLTAAGKAYCWGSNSSGELGDLTFTDRLVPTAVGGGHTFTDIAAGESFTCGLRDDSTILCWGYDGDGEGRLGRGPSPGSEEIPTAVSGTRTYASLDAGGDFACAISTGGPTFCWGANWGGQLGTGDMTDSDVPAAVQGGHAFTQISVGRAHACAIDDSDQAYCWGEAWGGRLGQPADDDVSVPQLVGGFQSWRSLTTGYASTCGITTGGTPLCWGYNSYGQLGNGGRTESSSPQFLSGSVAFERLASGLHSEHRCGQRADRVTYCWGYRGVGGVDGVPAYTTLPEMVTGITATRVVGGYEFTCALTDGGPGSSAYCWGDNGSGQLGVGQSSGTGESTPATVDFSGELTQIDLGANHACALDGASDAYCWGSNGVGQVGDGTNDSRARPTAVTGGHKWLDLATGAFFTCGVATDGLAYCWGGNGRGQLGDGTTDSRNEPGAVSGGLQFKAIGASYASACGVTVDDDLYCWGSMYYDFWGGVGDGTDQERHTPVQVGSGLSFTTVVGGENVMCALLADGTARCWGANYGGALGTGDSSHHNVPTAVSGAQAFQTISVGWGHVCGVTNGGQALCWGANYTGQYGNGTNLSANTPQFAGGPVDFEQIAAGREFTCGIAAGGQLYCWGSSGQWGRTGVGRTQSVLTPTMVNR